MNNGIKSEYVLKMPKKCTPGVSKIFHEIKNPIHGILGLSEHLSGNISRLSNHDILTFIEAIHNASKNLSDKINALSLSIVDNEEDMKLAISKHDIAKIIQESIQECYELQLLQKEIEIEFNYDNSIATFFVNVDGFWLKQLFINLLDNAFRHAQCTRIDISLNILEKNGDSFYNVIVSDNGIGFSEEKLQTIFSGEASFVADYQVGASFDDGRSLPRSYGIGLSICNEIIEAHKGYIKASNHANGAAINVLIPLSIA